jgi:hypothetical protein
MRIALPASIGAASSQLKPIGNVSLSYAASSVGNHAETVRDSYTVPTGRFAVVEYAFISITCSSAQSETNKVFANVKISFSGNPDRTILSIVEVMTMDGLTIRDHERPGIVLMPGDVIKITTRNATASGLYDFNIFVALALYSL